MDRKIQSRLIKNLHPKPEQQAIPGLATSLQLGCGPQTHKQRPNKEQYGPDKFPS